MIYGNSLTTSGRLEAVGNSIMAVVLHPLVVSLGPWSSSAGIGDQEVLNTPQSSLLLMIDILHDFIYKTPAIMEWHIYQHPPPNYPSRYPKYHLIETIGPLIEVGWGI